MYMLIVKVTTVGLDSMSLNDSGADLGIVVCSPPAANSVRAEEGVVLVPDSEDAAVPVGVVALLD